MNYYSNNKSFIELHNYLDSLGIKNNQFHLLTHNLELVNTDPDKKLCSYLIGAIRHEVCNNMYYFMREICNIELDLKSLSILWCMSNTRRFIIRQDPTNISNDMKMLKLISHYSLYLHIVNSMMNYRLSNIIKSDLPLIDIMSNDQLEYIPEYLRCGHINTYNTFNTQVKIMHCSKQEDLECLNDKESQIIVILDNNDIDLSSYNIKEFNVFLLDENITDIILV